MRKIFLLTLSSLMLSFSFADYTVLIGNTPKESIKFVTRTPPTPEVPPVTPEPPVVPDPPVIPEPPKEPPKEVCKYSYPSNSWEAGRNSSYPRAVIMAGNVYIYTGTNYNIREVIVGKIKYTKGAAMLITPEFVRYEICSIAIE